MALNGSGVFTRLYNWVTDKNNSVNITASRMDDEFDGIATALSTAMYKDGQQVPTANQSYGGYKITSLGDATADADALNRQTADVRYLSKRAEATVASASTTDILGATSDRVYVTGTTTITSFGTGTNQIKIVRFADALTITHDGTSLICPGAANIVTAAGDVAIVASDGSSNARIISYQRAESVTGFEVVDDTSPQLGGTLDANSKQVRLSKGADVASANALTLGTDGNFFDITGTTAITSIGTLGIGTVVTLQFDGILTLTHHATDLILPGAANITTAAGDRATFVEYASGDWICLYYTKVDPSATATVEGLVELATDAETQTGTDTARAITPANLTAAAIKQGKHTICIPAGSMSPHASAGPAVGSASYGAAPIPTLDFDQTTNETAYFTIWLPKSYNLGTVSAIFHWTADSGSGVVFWALNGKSVGNDDALNASFGTAANVTDTLLATGDEHATSETSAITLAGTPAQGDIQIFQITRGASDASDTLTADAKLIGITLFYTINAATDA